MLRRAVLALLVFGPLNLAYPQTAIAPALRPYGPFPGSAAHTPVLPEQAAAKLAELARPWRTQAQLERLRQNPRAPQESFEFTVLGDAEPGRFWFSRLLFNHTGVFPRLMRSVARERSDFVLQLGDMVSRGTRRNYLRFFDELSHSGIQEPYLTAIGNHDRRRPHGITDARMYQALFGDTNYFFDRGDVRFVVLDTSTRGLSREQLNWLDSVLDTDKTKIIFTHMAPSVIGAWNNFGPLHAVTGFKRGAREFALIAARRKVARVYSGHVHGFGVRDYMGVRYVLSGGGGSPLFPSGAPQRFYHYLTVRVGPRGLSEIIHKEDGTLLAIR